MTEDEAKQLPKPEKISVLAGLPQWLKEPESYTKVQKFLINEIRACPKTHSEMEQWAKCTKCQEAKRNRMEAILKFGFSGLQQYKAWQRVHNEMEQMRQGTLKKEALAKYNQ